MFAFVFGAESRDADTSRTYFQLASAAIIVSSPCVCLWRTWRGEQTWQFEEGLAPHQHPQHHGIDRWNMFIATIDIKRAGLSCRWKLIRMPTNEPHASGYPHAFSNGISSHRPDHSVRTDRGLTLFGGDLPCCCSACR